LDFNVNQDSRDHLFLAHVYLNLKIQLFNSFLNNKYFRWTYVDFFLRYRILLKSKKINRDDPKLTCQRIVEEHIKVYPIYYAIKKNSNFIIN